MGYKKEHLDKLLKLIEEISNQQDNAWFKNSLKRIFSDQLPSDKTKDILSVESKINLIQEYLAINLENVIDYSFFDQPSKEQLLRDCIEMCRYQKGTPNHKINFGEFCRYAHLQAEEMINYFLNKISNSDILKVEEYIKENNANYNPKQKPKEIHHIFYTQKLIAVKSRIGLTKKSLDLLFFLNDFRNELSHRNSLSILTDDKYLELFERREFGSISIDFKKLSEEDTEIFNRGKYIIIKRKEEYYLIYEVLEELKQKVNKALANPNRTNTSKTTIGHANPILSKIKDQLDKGGKL